MDSSSRRHRPSTQRCILGVILANMGMAAWYFGLHADDQVWITNTTTSQDLQIGLFQFSVQGASLTYTLNQEEYFVDWLFILGRYLYVGSLVLGLVLINLLLFSAWPVLSQNLQWQHRMIATGCILQALAPLGIMVILYLSELCHSNNLELQYRQASSSDGGDYYATTAVLNDDSEDTMDTPAATSCTPGDGGVWLLMGSCLWFLCSAVVLCLKTPIIDGGKGETNRTPLLSQEPLLDPPTRTLAYAAKLNTLSLFALVPYWTESALIQMKPELPPFFSSEVKFTSPKGGQWLGPTMFNPPQDIPYDLEQQGLVETAFDTATQLAYVPLLLNLMVLVLVLYGRQRLTHQANFSLGSLLVVLCLAGAAITLFIPGSVIVSDLCQTHRYPEFLFDELDDGSAGGWMGTGIVYHSTIGASCWPTTGMGQVLLLGALLFLLQGVLLVWFCFQYSNAQDTLLTFAGIDADAQRKALIHGDDDDEDDDDNSQEEVSFV